MTETDKNDYVRREAGILLHITSLPGHHGVGDLGRDAFRFVDFLRYAGMRLWQILPLTPLGLGDSPYASPSAMASNPLLISLDKLKEEGLLSTEDVVPEERLSTERVNYRAVWEFKTDRLRRAQVRFNSRTGSIPRSDFEAFCEEASAWLDDYSLFMALKDAHGGASWLEWEPEIVRRQPEALRSARERLSDSVNFHKFVQFEFSRQWTALREYANTRGVRIIGDVPIFVAMDSADVWSHQELFYLDEQGRPTSVAGVPPDYFSKTGQRWGNPLYRWKAMAEEGYRWWIDRFRMALSQTDIVRIDHFRGFQAYWEIPAERETAEIGRWVEGPGEGFFRAVEQALGRLPVIAENLGIITHEVEELRLALGYPGMAVLHFAFGDGAKNPYLPHNYERRCVAYTGTHDNDTTIGWFESRPREEQERVRHYLGDVHEIQWDLIRMLYRSVADLAIVPLQDVLGLGAEARMNIPGQAEGNWGWRMPSDQIAPWRAERLKEFVETYGRTGGEG